MFGPFAGRLDARKLKSPRDFAEFLASEVGEIQRQYRGRSKPIRYKGAMDLVIPQEALIVREAGGRTSDLRGGSFRIDSKEVVATNGWIHDPMVSVLNEGRIERGR